jgi:RimJ/RimL family protein N-acetyltransferase
MYNPYQVGKNIYLRHPTEDDVQGRWHEWFSDEETTRYMPERYWPNSIEKQNEFYKKVISNKERLVLSIVDIKDDKHIGVCNLSFINFVHGFCEIAFAIGEKEFRKGSYAFESVSLLLKIAFFRLNLRVVRSNYIESNEFTRNIQKVMHFKEIGKIKDWFWINGKYEGLIIEVLHRDDWLKRNKYI